MQPTVTNTREGAAGSGRMPVALIACQVLQAMLERLWPRDRSGEIISMDYGLHRLPGKMTQELQRAIDAIEAPSLVVLG